MELLNWALGEIGKFCISIISLMGYPGIFLLMVFESMILPIPSELVMPFAGFLIANGKMKFFWVILFSTLGSLTGSLISYYLGRYGGEKFIIKYGKFFFLNKEHLIKTEKWFFKKRGLTIFIGRFIPVVRHLISIPAGIGKMNIKEFIIYTIVGAGLWNAFLTYFGFVLGNNWKKIQVYSDYLSFGIILILIGIMLYLLLKKINKKIKN